MRIKLGEEGERGIYDLYKTYKKDVENPMEFKDYRRVLFALTRLLWLKY